MVKYQVHPLEIDKIHFLKQKNTLVKRPSTKALDFRVSFLRLQHVLLILHKPLTFSLAILYTEIVCCFMEPATFCYFSEGLPIPDFLQKSYFSVV